MVSKLSICNLALAHLGQAPISSLNQDDERARRLNLFYEPVRDEVLRAHNWGFAQAEKTLSRLAQTPGADGNFAYQYPAHALFICNVFDVQAPKQLLPFHIFFDENTQSRILKTASAQACARYTRRITDETLLDPAFVKVFSLALACDLAVALTADAQLAGQLLTKYQFALAEARRSNMSEQFGRVSAQDAFTEVR